MAWKLVVSEKQVNGVNGSTVNCCNCCEEKDLWAWTFGRSDERPSYDHREEKRLGMSKSEFETERIANESLVRRP